MQVVDWAWFDGAVTPRSGFMVVVVVLSAVEFVDVSLPALELPAAKT